MLPDRVVQISDQVVYKPVGDELVLLDFQTGMYFGLDPVAVRIWQLIAAHHPLAEIADTLVAEYDVPRETLERDIDALLEELERRGLVK
jgi:hypothetical protein